MAAARVFMGVRVSAIDDRLEWEQACVARVLRGETRAFAELYEAFARRLYGRVLLPKLGNASAAEEALADTFHAALEQLHRWEARGGSLYGWLVRIAQNRAIDVHRERKRTGKALASFESMLGPLQGPADLPVERALDQPRLRALADEVLATLPERARRAIELRFFEERERADCAEILQVSLGNFDVILLRALRAFRTAWVARHGSEEAP